MPVSLAVEEELAVRDNEPSCKQSPYDASDAELRREAGCRGSQPFIVTHGDVTRDDSMLDEELSKWTTV